jgi:threonine/homoserine/homoserine lactone efflux protein
MPDSASLLLFVATALVLLLTPGPAVLYIVARSLHQGRRAGLVSVLGIALGGVFHIVAATLGLSALLLSSVTAFRTVQYLGAAYLIFLGLRTLLTRSAADAASAPPPPRTLRRVFLEGVVVNALNPKAVIFFFAFLPQFVDVSQGHAERQLLLLGSIFLVLAVSTDSAYALAAGGLRRWLSRRPAILEAQRYVAGSVYLALGVVTAASGARPSS